MRIPRNQTTSGVEHGKGYVIYGLPRPTGTVSLSNVSQTLGTEQPGNNATGRIAAIDVITSNSFNVTLNTNQRILSDSFHDIHADATTSSATLAESVRRTQRELGDGGSRKNNNGQKLSKSHGVL